jgi:hypothetical protein
MFQLELSKRDEEELQELEELENKMKILKDYRKFEKEPEIAEEKSNFLTNVDTIFLQQNNVNKSFKGILPDIDFKVLEFEETDEAGLATLDKGDETKETERKLEVLKKETSIDSIVELKPRYVQNYPLLSK